MSPISIRPYQPTDETAIIDITYKTGFSGDDLTGSGYCDDAFLWYLIFIAYYTRYEPEHFLVAAKSGNDKVVGFICGALNTLTQEVRFRRKMVPRIALHLFFYTSWRYPHSFKTIFGMARQFSTGTENANDDPIIIQYPAHLHINILPGYQGMGIGTRLITRFEEHIRSLGVTGLHLGTSSKNRKAVPFYHKMGFTIMHESEIVPHPEFDDLRYLMFVKDL